MGEHACQTPCRELLIVHAGVEGAVISLNSPRTLIVSPGDLQLHEFRLAKVTLCATLR